MESWKKIQSKAYAIKDLRQLALTDKTRSSRWHGYDVQYSHNMQLTKRVQIDDQFYIFKSHTTTKNTLFLDPEQPGPKHKNTNSNIVGHNPTTVAHKMRKKIQKSIYDPQSMLKHSDKAYKMWGDHGKYIIENTKEWLDKPQTPIFPWPLVACFYGAFFYQVLKHYPLHHWLKVCGLRIGSPNTMILFPSFGTCLLASSHSITPLENLL